MIDLSTPEAAVAQQYMTHKGLSVKPYCVEQLEDQSCWYFLYRLPEGHLELEVYFNDKTQEWETTVTTFTLTH